MFSSRCEVFFLLWDLSYHHYIFASIYVYEGFQSFRWHQNDDSLCWVGLRQNIGLSTTEGGMTILSTYMSWFQYLWGKNNCFRGFQEIWLDIPILSLQWHAKSTFLLVTTWGSKIKRSFLWRSFCCAKTWKKQLQMISRWSRRVDRWYEPTTLVDGHILSKPGMYLQDHPS